MNSAALAAVPPAVNENTVAVDADDLTVVGASAAVGLARDKLHVPYGEVEELPLDASPGQYGRSHRAHQMAVFIDEDRAVQQLFKRMDDAHVLDLNAETPRLTGQKSARSGGTERVHGIIHGHAVFHENYFGILTADLQNGVYLRV